MTPDPAQVRSAELDRDEPVGVDRAPTAPDQAKECQLLQASWRFVGEYSSDLILHLGEGTRLLFLSAAASEFFGLDRKALEGKDLYDFVVEDDRRKLKKYLQDVARHKRRAALSLRCLHAQGQPRDVELICRCVPAEISTERHWLGLARLKRTVPHTSVPEGGPPMEQFALTSGLAHELNQPLTAIGTTARACVRLLHAGEVDQAELLEALEQTARQAERAGEIVRRLRDLVTEGRRHAEPTDLHVVIHETIRLLEEDLDSAGVQLHLCLAALLPPLKLDRVQIGQVLLNLMRNAVEAMQKTPPDERDLTIATTMTDQEVQVTVTDRGPGLSATMIGRLFEPFQTTKPQGMGVGLALSRRIVQAHGGRIWVQPNPDRGVTFCFTLPLGKEEP